MEDYYGIGSQSQRERREERERIDRLARFEQPGGVHEQERERAALYERERVRLADPQPLSPNP